MNSKVSALVVFLFVMSAAAIAVISVDSSNADSVTEYTVAGYVGEIKDTGAAAAVDVTVTLGTEIEKYTAKTGSDGVFVIKISTAYPNKVSFNCSKDGYSVEGLPACISEKEGSEDILDLTKVTPTADGRCVVSEESDYKHGIQISKTLVSPTIIVMGAHGYLHGAEITLTKDSRIVTAGKTDNLGICMFNTEISVGSYQAKITCDGYKTAFETLEIGKTATQFTIDLDKKEVTNYFGMTLYHLLMILGVTIGLVLVILAYVLCSRTWKGLDSED